MFALCTLSIGCSSGGGGDNGGGGSQKLTPPDPMEDMSHPAIFAISISNDGNKLYAFDRGDGSVTNQDRLLVIDTTNHDTLADISLGVGFAFNIALSPDETTGYVSVSDFSGSTNTTGNNNRVAVVDLENGTVTESIPINE